MANKAVFLDRDGTLMDDPGYLADPAGVKLLPGVDLAIKSLRQAGYKIIVVTNQSGVARGLLSEETLEKIHAELRRRLADKNAVLDAIYYCPYHPEGSVPQYTRESELRKPAPGMLFKAAEELDLELKDCWMVGDAGRDVAAGLAAGCRTIRIRSEQSHDDPDDAPDDDTPPDMTVRNLVDAARVILRAGSSQPATEDPDGPAPADPYEIQEDSEEEIPPPEPYTPETTPTEETSRDEEEMLTDTPHRVFTAAEAPIEDDSNIRKEILRHVRQMSKQAETEEFSLVNLLGGVVQILVILLLLLVFWKALGKDQYDQALLWAVVAVVLQTMSMTFFLMARSKR
ncbi:MAG: HAD family hydrolase [Phycisphaerae bacterium]|nr:HAD family hydrolase [Phycisphaerae bacterium]